MPTNGSAVINPGDIKVRWKEPFLTQGLNRKGAGVTPRGIYRGFRPAINNLGTGLVLSVEPDLAGTGTITTVQGDVQAIESDTPVFDPELVGRTLSIGAVSGRIVKYISPTRLIVGTLFTPGLVSWSIQSKINDSVAVFEDSDPLRDYSLTITLTSDLSVNRGSFPFSSSVTADTGTLATISSLADPAWYRLNLSVGTYSAAKNHFVKITVASDSRFIGTFSIGDAGITYVDFYHPDVTSIMSVSGVTWQLIERSWVVLRARYDLALETSAAIDIVTSGSTNVGSLVDYPQALHICRIDRPLNLPSWTGLTPDFIDVGDPTDPDITSRPWDLRDVRKEAHLIAPGSIPFAVQEVQTFLMHGTYVDLEGDFYVGSDTNRDFDLAPERYFRFVQDRLSTTPPSIPDGSLVQLLYSDRSPVEVDLVSLEGTSIPVNPIYHADKDGFVKNPRVHAASSLPSRAAVVAYRRTSVGGLDADQGARVPIGGVIPPAQYIPVQGINFTHISTATDNVQDALVGIDQALTGFGGRFVTVGLAGSGADFRSDLAPSMSVATAFQNAINAVGGPGGGRIVVLPGVYEFDATVDITHPNITISGVVAGSPGVDTGVVLRLSTHRGVAAGGGIFSITSVGSIVFEDLLFRDIGSTAASYSALIYSVISGSSGGVKKGPALRRCTFDTNINSSRALKCSVTLPIPTDYYSSVEVVDCIFGGTGAAAIPVVDVDSAVDLQVRNNRFEGSIALNGYWLQSTVNTNFTQNQNIVVSNNNIQGSIGGFASVSTANTPVINVETNTFITTSSVSSGFGFLYFNINITSTTSYINVHTNIFKIDTAARPLFEMAGASTAAHLIIQNNELISNGGAVFYNVHAATLNIEGNRIYGKGIPGAYLRTIPTPTAVFIASNDWIMAGSANAGTSALNLPANTIFQGNTFKRAFVGGTDFKVGIRIRSNTSIIGNLIDFSDSTCVKGEVILALSDGTAPVVLSNIAISNNTIKAKNALPYEDIPNAIGVESAYIAEWDGVVISNNLIADVLNCVKAYDDKPVKNLQFNGNSSSDIIFGAIIGAHAQTVDNSFSNNMFEFRGDIVVDGAVYGIRARDQVRVEGNTFKGPRDPTGALTNPSYLIRLGIRCSVLANTVINIHCAGRCIVVDYESEVCNNYIYSWGTAAFSLGDFVQIILVTERCVVANNNIVVADSQSNLIAITANTDCIVTGNLIRQLAVSITAAVTAIVVNSDSIVDGNDIRDLSSFLGSVRGIAVDGSGVVVSNNLITALQAQLRIDGIISIAGQERITIIGNQIYDVASNTDDVTAISLASDGIVSSNTIRNLDANSGTATGVYVNGSGVAVTGNEITLLRGGTIRGIDFATVTERASIANNSIYDCIGTMTEVYVITAPSDSIVSNNIIRSINGGAFDVTAIYCFGSGTNISNNEISNLDGKVLIGIHSIAAQERVTASSNTIYDVISTTANVYGIRFQSGNSAAITANILDSMTAAAGAFAAFGISIVGGANAAISSNVIRNIGVAATDASYGIWCDTNVVNISGNTINDMDAAVNADGIFLISSPSARVIVVNGNLITGSAASSRGVRITGGPFPEVMIGGNLLSTALTFPLSNGGVPAQINNGSSQSNNQTQLNWMD